jgi:hypothetical protein
LIDAGVQYWILAFEPDINSSDFWSYANIGSGDWAYNLSGSPTGPWTGPSNRGGNPLLDAFQVDGNTTVPEPGTMLLVSVALAGLAGLKRIHFH